MFKFTWKYGYIPTIIVLIIATPSNCSVNLCQNGGTCVNLNVTSTDLFGFKCNCPIGYSGDLCEKSLLFFIYNYWKKSKLDQIF